MAKLCPPHYDRPRLETFKMSKYIVDVTAEPIQPPEYLRNIGIESTNLIDFQMLLKCNQEGIKLRKQISEQESDPSTKSVLPELMSFQINPLELGNWPSAEQLGMDQPQYVAFQSAITQEISIIQGPVSKHLTFLILMLK